MTRSFRFLTDESNSSSSSSSSATASVDSDFVVILAALLCALICVLGLIAVARCACLRRLRLSSSPLPPPPSLPSSANKGLKKKVLRSLPKLTATAESAVKFSDCAICLSEFSAGEEIRVLPQCGHGFHVTCIDAWLGSHSSCPSCRQILVVSRCQKCGGIPASSSSSSSSSSTSSPAAATAPSLGMAQEERLKVRETENDANRFLP